MKNGNSVCPMFLPCVNLLFPACKCTYIVHLRELSWSWSYGSWIYDHLCNQCLPPSKVVSSNPAHDYVYNKYVINLVSYLWHMVYSGYSGFLHQWQCPPRYSWNIVESGVKCHNFNYTPCSFDINCKFRANDVKTTFLVQQNACVTYDHECVCRKS